MIMQPCVAHPRRSQRRTEVHLSRASSYASIRTISLRPSLNPVAQRAFGGPVRNDPIFRCAALILVALVLAACSDPAVERSPPELPGSAVPGQPQGMEPASDTAPDNATLTVQVYFSRDEQPEPVEREIPRTPAVLRTTIETLLRGPTAAEREAGLFSWFSEETAGLLRDVRLDDDGRAIVDFGDLRRVIPNASTAAGSRVLLNELNGTVFQFEEVRAVEYRLDGSCDAFWQWLQRDCDVVERP